MAQSVSMACICVFGKIIDKESKMKTKRVVVAVTVMVVLSMFPATITKAGDSQGSNFLVARRVTEAPTIDGKTGDACWQEIPWVQGYVSNNRHEPTKFPTQVRCGFDDKALYLLFRCTQNKADIVANLTEHDDPVWYDSGIELFLSPDVKPIDMMLQPQGMHFAQLIFNAIGTRFEQIGKNGGSDWDMEWTVKTTISEDHWIAEVEIPFKFIGKFNWKWYKPAEFTTWDIQLIRNSHGKDTSETSALFPVTGMNHNQTCFGKLVFVNKANDKEIAKQIENIIKEF